MTPLYTQACHSGGLISDSADFDRDFRAFKAVEQDFPIPALLITLRCGGCSVHCRMLGGIPGLPTSPLVQPKQCLQTLLKVLWGTGEGGRGRGGSGARGREGPQPGTDPRKQPREETGLRLRTEGRGDARARDWECPRPSLGAYRSPRTARYAPSPAPRTEAKHTT